MGQIASTHIAHYYFVFQTSVSETSLERIDSDKLNKLRQTQQDSEDTKYLQNIYSTNNSEDKSDLSAFQIKKLFSMKNNSNLTTNFVFNILCVIGGYKEGNTDPKVIQYHRQLIMS